MIEGEGQAKDWLRTLPDFTDTAMARLEQLVEMLVAENARQNLVSAASLAHVWQRHIADSAQLLGHVPRETTGPWLDLGTGAGFPGLVVSILQPEREVVMVESRSKRAEWLRRVCNHLGVISASVEAIRVELLPSRAFSVISARAFAPLDRIIGLSARFSTPATHWLLPKGRSARLELASLEGWNHLFHVEHSLTDQEAGLIVGTLSGKKGRTR